MQGALGAQGHCARRVKDLSGSLSMWVLWRLRRGCGEVTLSLSQSWCTQPVCTKTTAMARFSITLRYLMVRACCRACAVLPRVCHPCGHTEKRTSLPVHVHGHTCIKSHGLAQAVALDAPMLDLTLFLGNLPEGTDDAKLREEVAKYGELQRCFVMRNKDGESKVGSRGNACNHTACESRTRASHACTCTRPCISTHTQIRHVYPRTDTMREQHMQHTKPLCKLVEHACLFTHTRTRNTHTHARTHTHTHARTHARTHAHNTGQLTTHTKKCMCTALEWGGHGRKVSCTPPILRPPRLPAWPSTPARVRVCACVHMQGYGFAEFVLPGMCQKAKKDLEQQQRQVRVLGGGLAIARCAALSSPCGPPQCEGTRRVGARGQVRFVDA